jgi:hypothetical protein
MREKKWEALVWRTQRKAQGGVAWLDWIPGILWRIAAKLQGLGMLGKNHGGSVHTMSNMTQGSVCAAWSAQGAVWGWRASVFG